MAHEEQRQAQHTPSTCTDPVTGLPCAVQSPVPYRRIADPCGDVVLPDPCVPGTFVTPPERAYVPPELPAELPFVAVANEEQAASCSDLDPAPGVTVVGSDVTVAASTLSSQVSLALVTGITDIQRSGLATLTQEVLDGFGSLTALQIAQASGLSLDQATELKTAIDAAVTELNEQALTLALEGLNCYYLNTQQSASCASGSDTPTSVVPAGAVTSYISQEDADANALAQAQAALHCVWTNDTQTAACGAGAVGDHITATVTAGTVSSIVSKEDANAQASAMALSALVCLYPNEEVVVECEPSDVAADATDSNPITVAAGTIFSNVSVEDATAQAEIAANLLLRCQWSNTLEDPVVCPADGEHEASETASPVYSVRPAAGTFISTLSRADANAMAHTFALAQLDCRYCNDEVPALCDDPEGSDDATAAVLAGSFCETTFDAAQSLATALAAIPIAVKVTGTPVCHYTNDRRTAACVEDEDLPEQLYKFSVAAGVGLSPGSSGVVVVDAGSITSIISKADANEQAEAFALALLNCFFDSAENEPLACPEEAASGAYPPFSEPLILPVGFFTSYTSQLEANNFRDAYLAAILDCFFESEESDPAACPEDAATGSYPPSETPLTLPAGFFTSYTSLVEANNLRDTYLASILNCFWKNDAQTKWCDNDEDTEAIAPKNATVPENTLVSLVSKVDANALASALATASLICNYSNDAQTADACPGGTTQLQAGTTAEGTIIAGSKATANTLAKTLANALNVCVADTFFTTLVTPGSQGPAGNCDTPCGAFYS
jgi:hypothetical protein